MKSDISRKTLPDKREQQKRNLALQDERCEVAISKESEDDDEVFCCGNCHIIL